MNHADYIRWQQLKAELMGNLWCCPKCGIIGRLLHQYMAPFPKPPGIEPGECNPEVLKRAGYGAVFDSGGGI